MKWKLKSLWDFILQQSAWQGSIKQMVVHARKGVGYADIYSLLAGVQTGTATTEINVYALRKLKVDWAHTLAKLFLSKHPQGSCILFQRHLLMQVQWCCFTHSSQKLEIASVFINCWVTDNENVAYYRQWDLIQFIRNKIGNLQVNEWN